jgi:hypothetical protein
VEIWVPAGVRVEMECSAVLASVASEVPEPNEGAPAEIVVRLTGRALFSNVEVKVILAPNFM